MNARSHEHKCLFAFNLTPYHMEKAWTRMTASMLTRENVTCDTDAKTVINYRGNGQNKNKRNVFFRCCADGSPFIFSKTPF